MIVTNFTLVSVGVTFGVIAAGALAAGYLILPPNDLIPLPEWNVIGGLFFAIGAIIGASGLRRA